MQSGTVENVFARSWQLLRGNWNIVVPGLIVGLVSGLAIGIALPPFAPDSADPGALLAVSGRITGGLIGAAISLLATIVTTTYTTGMAGAAWQRGVATFGDGGRAFERDAGHVLVAMIGLFALGLVAAMLAIFTLGLSLLVYLFLAIYTMASAVVGERSGLEALAESARIAIRRVGPTLLLVAVVCAIAIVAGIISGLLSFAPLIGPIVAALVTQAVLAYITLVIVGEYLELRASAGPTVSP